MIRVAEVWGPGSVGGLAAVRAVLPPDRPAGIRIPGLCSS